MELDRSDCDDHQNSSISSEEFEQPEPTSAMFVLDIPRVSEDDGFSSSSSDSNSDIEETVKKFIEEQTQPDEKESIPPTKKQRTEDSIRVLETTNEPIPSASSRPTQESYLSPRRRKLPMSQSANVKENVQMADFGTIQDEIPTATSDTNGQCTENLQNDLFIADPDEHSKRMYKCISEMR